MVESLFVTGGFDGIKNNNKKDSLWQWDIIYYLAIKYKNVYDYCTLNILPVSFSLSNLNTVNITSFSVMLIVFYTFFTFMYPDKNVTGYFPSYSCTKT